MLPGLPVDFSCTSYFSRDGSDVARRVIISSSSVLVSPSGVDAATATDQQLLFNSGGLPYNGLYMSGRLSSVAFSESTAGITGGGTQYTRTATISFGKTFAAAPRVIFGVRDPDFSYNSYTPYWGVGNNVTSPLTGSQAGLSLSVGTSSMTFTEVYDYWSGGAINRLIDVSYAVFQV